MNPTPPRRGRGCAGSRSLRPRARARAKAIAVWREKLARARDLPRAWILADPAIFATAQGAPPPLNDSLAASLQAALENAPDDPADQEPSQDARPTPEQKALIERLGKVVDARAAELNISAEILAPRGELKALAMSSPRTRAARVSRADGLAPGRNRNPLARRTSWS